MLLWYLWPLRKKAPEISLTSLFLWDLNSTSRDVDSLDNHHVIKVIFELKFQPFWRLLFTMRNMKKKKSMLQGKSKLELIWDLSSWICKLFVIYKFFYTTLSSEEIIYIYGTEITGSWANPCSKVRRKRLWDIWPKLFWRCTLAPYLVTEGFFGVFLCVDFCCCCFQQVWFGKKKGNAMSQFFSKSWGLPNQACFI